MRFNIEEFQSHSQFPPTAFPWAEKAKRKAEDKVRQKKKIEEMKVLRDLAAEKFKALDIVKDLKGKYYRMFRN